VDKPHPNLRFLYYSACRVQIEVSDLRKTSREPLITRFGPAAVKRHLGGGR
jgi:hypothetical protein